MATTLRQGKSDTLEVIKYTDRLIKRIDALPGDEAVKAIEMTIARLENLKRYAEM